MAHGLRNLRFRCTACGKCCRTIRVPITGSDLKRLMARTNEAPERLIDWLAPDAEDMTGEPESFVRLREGRRLMVLAHRAAACRFLGADERCTVYAARPENCALYPFHLQSGKRGGIRRLRLFVEADCEYRMDGTNDP